MNDTLNPMTLLSPLLSAAPATFAVAVHSGISSPSVGTAFLGGYRAALAALVPTLAHPALPALAATESGPLHPREIRTTLTDGLLTGSKRYVTGVPGADRAVVLATTGQAQEGLAREKVSTEGLAREKASPERASAEVHPEGLAREKVSTEGLAREKASTERASAEVHPSGRAPECIRAGERVSAAELARTRESKQRGGSDARKQAQEGLAREKVSTEGLAREKVSTAKQQLVAVVVSLVAPGVTVRPMPPTPFVPDVPHAEIDFRDAPILSVIPGDGWANVVRPFRTAEDIYVLSGVTGYLIGVGARSGWPVSAVAPLCSVLSSFSALSVMDFSAPGTHVALAGAISQLRAAIASLSWEQVDPDEESRWRRDVALLSVAERAREARLAKAWSDLQGG